MIIITGTAILAGIIGALIGLGGGIIITPFLVIAFGIDIRYAMGAALTSVIATSSGAAAAYVRDGISNLKIGMFLSIATTLGAVFWGISSFAHQCQYSIHHIWNRITHYSRAFPNEKISSKSR